MLLVSCGNSTLNLTPLNCPGLTNKSVPATTLKCRGILLYAHIVCPNKPKKCDFKILPKMRPKVVFDINHVSSTSYVGDVLTIKVVTEFLFGH